MGWAVGRRHIDGLDGVRGAAVAAVLLFHAGHLTGGWLGVDLFFVLSGFLITSLLLGERDESGRVSLSAFWSRRARRLLPALLLVLLGVCVYAAVLAEPRELAGIRGDALSTLGYVANWHQIADGHQYWDLFEKASPLQHVWSLAIEEQFYVLWPLVVVAVLAVTRSTRAVLIVSLVGAIASFAAMVAMYEPGSDPQRVYLGTDTRASSILVGAALAAFVTLRRMPDTATRGRRILELAAVASIGFLSWSWLNLSGGDPSVYQGMLLATAIGGLVVIAAVAHPVRGPIARALSIRPLRALGVISYGVYLWHWPVYMVLDPERLGLDGWALTTVRITVTLVVSFASFTLLERPIRRGARATPQLRMAAVCALMSVIAIVIGTTVPRSAPVVDTAHVRLTPASVETRPPIVSLEPVRVTLIGDSLASTLMPAFSLLGGAERLVVTDRSYAACSLHEGATGKRADSDYAYLLHVDVGTSLPLAKECSDRWVGITTQDDPDVVVLVLAGSIIGEFRVAEQWVGACDPAFDRWYGELIDDQLRPITDAGVPVLIVLPVPSFFAQHQTACLRRVEQGITLTNPAVEAVDLRDLQCPTGKCDDVVNGVTMRADGFHYTGSGADLVVRWLAPALRGIALEQSEPLDAGL